MEFFKLVSCINKIRLGKDYDGGYIICDNLNYDIILGCGVCNDLSFEDNFIDKYNCDCIVFDGNISKIPKNKNNIKLIFMNIYSHSLDYLLNIHNNIFLKMDIEGCEWDFFDKLNISQLNKINQMVIEFHNSPKKWGLLDDYKINILKKICETHYLIHIHGNNNHKSRKIYDKNICDVFEATFLNKKYIDKPLFIKYKYDNKLDMKNVRSKNEVYDMYL